MVFKKTKKKVTTRRIRKSQDLSLFAIQEARRILEERNEEFLRELKKTLHETLVTYGPRKGWTLISLGPKKQGRFNLYHGPEIAKEIGSKHTIGAFTCKRFGTSLSISELYVGNFLGTSNLRGLGIARLLIDISKEIAQKRGLKAIRLTAIPGGVEQMYAKMGFKTLYSSKDGSKHMIYFVDPELEKQFDPQNPMKIFDELLKA